MNKLQVQETITSLPLSQQVTLLVIFKMENIERKDFSFLSSQLANELKPYVKKHLSVNQEEYGKFVGAVLSGLMRNKILIRLTGDRDKLWTLSKEVKENLDPIRKKLFEIKTYWN
ncbi:hypothetical protein ACFL18_00640 [Patescibacteria group bacterium]